MIPELNSDFISYLGDRSRTSSSRLQVQENSIRNEQNLEFGWTF